MIQVIEKDVGTICNLKNKFLRAKRGDIVRVTIKATNTYNTFVLGLTNQQDSSKKAYQLFNLSTGYIWRIGGENLSDAFDVWFKNDEELTISDLNVYKESKLILDEMNIRGGF